MHTYTCIESDVFFWNAELVEATSALWEQLQTITLQGKVLSLQQPAYFLLVENGREMWVRKCYEDLAKIIMDLYEKRLNMRDLNSRVGVVITGNPGIGKSFFFFYLLWVLAQRKVCVVLRLAQENITCLFRPEEAPQVVGGSFFRFKELDCVETVFLHDPKPGEEPPKVNAFTIIASSPKKSNFRDFLKRKTTKFYMPVWSLEELESCNSALWKMSPKDLRSAFLKFGGITRYIVDPETSLLALQEAINQAENLDSLFKDASKIELAPESSHKLLQYSVSESFEVSCIQFASEYVYKQLRERWYKNNELQEIRDFLRYENFAEKKGMCGFQWQWLARNRLLRVCMYVYVCM
jgi:hypothetical protein